MRILTSVTSWDGVRIQAELTALGFPITPADDGIAIFESLDLLGHPVTLVETGLPDLRWTVAVKQLRKESPSMSILVVDTADSAEDRTRALSLGADDIIRSDMPGSEVAARILAVATRRAGYSGPVLNIGQMKVSLQERRVWWGATPVHMSPTQYSIFETLCLTSPELVSKDDILGEIYGLEPIGDARTIDVFMATLRSRLARAGAPRSMIETVHGRGYRLVEVPPTSVEMTASLDLPVEDIENPVDHLRRAA